MKKKNTLTPYRVICAVILAVLAVFFLFPLYWIITGSVKEKSDIIIKSGEMVKWIPTTITWDNYQRLFKTGTELFGIGMPMAIRWLFNSVFIAVLTTVLTVILFSGRICPCQEALLGKKFDFWTVCVCNGSPEAGYFDSPDDRDVQSGAVKERMGLHVCSYFPGSRMALWRIPDEAVLREYSNLVVGGGPD